MTPGDFAARFGDTARVVSAGTGIDPIVLLAQWANETAWGTQLAGNNLGNIRCSPTTFCRYATLDDFAAACIATFHNGFYGAVLAATTAQDQLAAIVASPWSSGHYGGSLQSFYDPLEVYEMTPEEHAWLKAVYTVLSPVSLKQILDVVVQIQKTQATSGALTPAQAQQLTDIQTKLQTLAALTPAQAQQLSDIQTRLQNLTLKVL